MLTGGSILVRVLTRASLLGGALATLGVRRSAQGRRRIITRAQTPFAVVLTALLAAVVPVGVPEGALPWLIAAWSVTIVVTALGYVVPWEGAPEITGIVLGAIDLLATAAVNGVLPPMYPTVGALQLLPVIILAFSFGLIGTVVAMAGSVVIALAPLVVTGGGFADAHDWVTAVTVPVMVAVLAGATQFGSRMLQRVQQRYAEVARASDDEQAITMTVLNAMDVGTAYVRPDGTIAFTNEAFRALIARAALDPDRRAGLHVYEHGSLAPVPADQQMLAQAMRGEHFDSKIYVVGDVGDRATIMVTARPVQRADGADLGTAFVSKDITELDESIRVREEFLSVVSHELRTPLISIIGYLEVLDDDIDADALGVRGYLDILGRNAQQLMLRIGDLLHVADPHRSIRATEVDVPALVAGSVASHRPRADAAAVTLELDDHGTFVALLDEPRVRQVVDNLITNAVKYTPAGGRVRVAMVLHDDASFSLTVTDNGIGIAEHELKHVFEKFYRSAAARDAVIPGSGLGLAIVKDIAAAHGGEVTARSRIGSGSSSSFTVRLPLAPAAA